MGSMRMLFLATLYQVAAVVLGTGLCAVLWPAGAIGMLLVGGFAAANFWAWQVLVRRAFTAGQARPVYLVALASKLVVTLGLLTLVILVLKPPPLAVALGLSTLFVGLALAMVHLALAPAKAQVQKA